MKSPILNKLVRTTLLLALIFANFQLLTGCSDLIFVNNTEQVPEKDTREDIVITSLSANLTSGGVTLQRVGGDEAIYSTSENRLYINDINVITYNSDKTTQSITHSNMGAIYLADSAEYGRKRKDMEFSGNVLYRAPMKDTPTSDSLRMTTEHVIWDQNALKFYAPQNYEMILSQKGKNPIRQLGQGFEATRDLRRFVVKAGAVTSDMVKDPRLEQDKFMQEFKQLSGDVAAELNKPFPKPASTTKN